MSRTKNRPVPGRVTPMPFDLQYGCRVIVHYGGHDCLSAALLAFTISFTVIYIF